MIDLVKLLTDNPNAKALMTEIYNFEESLAKVGRAETLSMVIFDIFLLNCFLVLTLFSLFALFPVLTRFSCARNRSRNPPPPSAVDLRTIASS